ncbi:MAG: TetR/AcrR family transcriptional regulator [Acidimicrobiales bacterium]|nr:TetR/AcrR family transcriptional regulator [Acidimicrobiaceae bacterium]MXV88833.1 TetR/AcrR family transcriptional regulator [Acidimicrobiales bacterium]MXX43351.1 TetR/AcrR family transcriptional regulator [Acidimicrobiales bacterium]MXZ14437.1 TetR/AcrR family transcriptional regulator [Acidimicrobiales bacterium]MYB82666.1 TetR/AcrR family transcriptional regulator [Acidimicrobiales bacterium]
MPVSDHGDAQRSGSDRRGDQGDHDHAAVAQRLIDSAIRAFGDKGFQSASVSEIAREAGTTADAVYARWSDKRELFDAAFREAAERRMLLLIKNAPEAAASKLAMLGDNLLTTHRDNTRDLWIEACAHAMRDEDWRPMLAAALDVEARELSEIVEDAKAAGDIDHDLSTTAIVFLCQSLGLGSHLVARSLANNGSEPDADDWSRFIGRLIRGLAPRA